jgi:hypothetical protein
MLQPMNCSIVVDLNVDESIPLAVLLERTFYGCTPTRIRLPNIAVLEFKNTFVLREADFRPAMANASEAEQMLEDAFETDNKTLLTGNAYWLSKQAKKYHGESHTADVAIFDWNNMVVFDFSGMFETPINPKLTRAIVRICPCLAHAGDKKVKRFHFSEIIGRLPYVRATVTAIWFSEAGKNHNQHQTFPAFLLGFLIRALRRHNLVT